MLGTDLCSTLIQMCFTGMTHDALHCQSITGTVKHEHKWKKEKTHVGTQTDEATSEMKLVTYLYNHAAM